MNVILPFSKENVEYAKKAIEERAEQKCWYVLHYDTHTTEYLNEIEFMTYEEACKKFKKEQSYTIADRVELMFAPFNDDEEFDHNIVVNNKRTFFRTPKGLTPEQKLEFYDNLIQEGLNVDELIMVRNRIHNIDTYFQPTNVITKKAMILAAIQEIVAEEK